MSNLAVVYVRKKCEGKKSRIFGERPPGLINHVLTVLVFRSWVLVTPHLPCFIQEPQSVPLA